MRTNLPHQPYRRPSPYRGLGRMLLASFVIHLVVFFIFGGGFLPRKTYKRPPAIKVNLANLPVAKPQAGRTDAVKGAKEDKPLAARAKPKPKSTPKPKAKPTVKIPDPKPPEPKKVEPKKPEPKPPEPKKVEPKKSEPEKPTVAKKPAKPKPPPKAKGPTPEQIRAKKLENLRKQRQKEAERLAALDAEKARDNRIKALKDKLAALSTNAAARDQGAAAPVGEPDGTGDQEGLSFTTWVKEYIQAQWRLSKYQLGRRDLSAEVKLIYNPDGSLVDYSFLRKSGDAVFDASLRSAILKAQMLPKPLGKREEFDIVFNLNDLQE